MRFALYHRPSRADPWRLCPDIPDLPDAPTARDVARELRHRLGGLVAIRKTDCPQDRLPGLVRSTVALPGEALPEEGE